MTSGPPPREAWQAASAGHSTKSRRIGTAILLLLFAAIAIIIFITTLRGPSVARPFVQSMYVPDYDQLVAHSPYVPQDIQRMRDLFAAPGEIGGSKQTYNEYEITSGAPLTDQQLQSERLKNFEACQSKDIAIFYIAANGVVDSDRHPGLLSSDGNINRLEELLSQIQAISASTKLVFLDAGQLNEDYLNGELINEFPFALHQLLAGKSGDENTYKENLWVINSHGLFQKSRLSHTRSGSVFAVSVSDALEDFRQNGDPNEPIKLGQLYQSICKRCAAMTMDGDRPAQMPLLMRGGHGIVFYSDLKVRDEALDQDVIYLSQMNRAASPEPVAQETPPETEAKEPVDPPSVADASGEKKETAEPKPAAEETALERIWILRDQLQNRQLGNGYSPVDFAPHIWLRINDQIVLFDQLKRCGGEPASEELKKTEADLNLLASLMKANEASNDARYKQNLLDVSARLVAEWNRFVSSTPAGATMNQEIGAGRDIYFRSRYLLEWTLTPAFRNSPEMQEVYLALFSELKRIRPLVFSSSIQSTELDSLAVSVAKLRVHEQQMWERVNLMVAELNKTETNRSPGDVYRIEQVFNSLLDSPLLGYNGPNGSETTGSESGQPHILSRKSLNKAYDELLAQNLRPVPAEDSNFQWATDLWIAPGQKNVNDSQDNIRTVQAFLELGDEATRFDTKNDCQLPDRSRSTIQEWEAGVSNCLTILRDPGTKTRMAQAGFAQAINQLKPESLQAWPLAILLDQKTVHTIAQPQDTLFVAFPPDIKKITEPVVVEFDIGPGKIDTTKIDLDRPITKRQFFFTTTGGDPRNVNLRLSIDDAEKEFANLLEFTSDESGLVQLDQPFSFPLVRGTDGEFLPFSLTIRSSPTNARQSRREIGIKLGLTGSDDGRVRIRDGEYLPFTVQLPREDRVDLVVANSSFSSYSVSAISSADSRSYYDRQANLFAFPNRFRNIDFRLENKSGRKKKLKLELFSVARPDSFDKTNVLPGQVVGRSLQDPAVVAQQLESLKRATLARAPVATSNEVELAPDSGALLDFRPVPVIPVEPSESPGNGPSGQTAPQAETLMDFNNGIYCRLSESDVEHGSQIIRDFWFDIKPLPSEELVEATATFDPLSQLFSVQLVPRWSAGTLCPVPGGVECVLETGNSSDFTEKIVSFSDKLDDEKRKIELQFKISQEELVSIGPVLLYVNINEYRGVFIYKLAETDFQGQARTKENLRKDNNFLVLRRITTRSEGQEPVTHLKTGGFWAFAPPESMRFEVLADIDDGVSDDCQIQLDFKREEWTTPRPQLRTSDRQIAYLAKINETNGLLDLQARVNDHVFDVALAGKVNGKCELGGRVIFPENRTNLASGNTTFVESLRIDGSPPIADETRWVIDGVKQGKFVSIKENQQQVQLEFVSSDLVGTRSVQLFVDKDNDPVVSDADTKLDTAAPTGQKENWKFLFDIEKMLKAETLAVGDNNIYAILVDQLGNETDRNIPVGPLTLTVSKLTEQERAMFEEAKIKKYTLNIQLSRRDSTPVPKPLPPDIRARIIGSDDQEIQFRSEANEDGSYSVFDVPVGEYKLVCEYIHTTPTHVKKKLRKEQPLQLSIQKAPGPIVLILEEVKEDE